MACRTVAVARRKGTGVRQYYELLFLVLISTACFYDSFFPISKILHCTFLQHHTVT